MRKTIHVAAAVIRRDGKIFATRRGYGPWKDWWEFPGGKIEAGETPAEAIVREISEELDVRIRVDGEAGHVEYDYPEFHLSMECLYCTLTGGQPVLKEHEDARWLGTDELGSVDWLPADRLLVNTLKESISKDERSGQAPERG